MDLLDGTWRRPDPALLTLRRIGWLVTLAVLGGVGAAALLLYAGPVEALAGTSIAAGTGVLGWLLVGRQVAAIGYAERQDDLLVRRGVLVRRLSVVPYGRMQYVDVVAGPLARRFGLATVVLHTAAAATDAELPGLARAEADRLRDRLAALGEARAAGV